MSTMSTKTKIYKACKMCASMRCETGIVRFSSCVHGFLFEIICKTHSMLRAVRSVSDDIVQSLCVSIPEGPLDFRTRWCLSYGSQCFL